MSTNLQKKLFYYGERPVPYDKLNSFQTYAENLVAGLTQDILLGNGSGGWLSEIEVTPTSTPTLSVLVPACEGVDGVGKHLKTTSPTTIDCSLDYLGASCVPSSGNLWIAIFALFQWTTNTTQSVSGYAEPFPILQTQSVLFRVYKGSASAPPDNPGGGAIRLCNILMTEGITQILSGNIYYSTVGMQHQDRVVPLSGMMPKAGGQFTGTVTDIRGARLVGQKSGEFKWVPQIPVPDPDPEDIPAAWPDFMKPGKFRAFKIWHGLGAVDCLVFARPKVLNAIAYANFVSMTNYETGGLNHGIYTINERNDDDTAYTGWTQIIVYGSETWVKSLTRLDTGVSRHWRWTAIY